MAGTLSGKKALVTGGSRGIGAGIVRRLAQEGADLALTYSSSKQAAESVLHEANSAGVKVIAIHADSADPSAVAGAVEQTVKELGGIDILVNNAGIAVFAPIENFTLEDFDRIFAVNVRAVFVASQAAARHMQSGGRIINIGSCNADRIPFPNGSVYAMSKSALQGLVQGMARDLGPRGITINNVQPGPIDTEMNPANGPLSSLMTSAMALTRFGTSEEVASFVAYLAGPDAGFITGASLTIDGGFSA